MKGLRPFLLILLCSLLVNCSTISRTGDVTPVPSVEVRLYNYNWKDVKLYIMQGGFSRSAGRASTMSHSILHVRIPGTGVAVRFFARFTAGNEAWLSPDLNWIYRGSCVVVRIENHLTLSSVLPC